MAAACSHLEPTITTLTTVVAAGAPQVSDAVAAEHVIDSVELMRRLAAVATIDVLEQIHVSRAFYEHGHANARVMLAHIGELSGAEAHQLVKIRRMVNHCNEINTVWRTGSMSVAKAAILGRAFANPRSRDRFLLDQHYFLKNARKLGVKRFERRIARWVEIHDSDGPNPDPDPSHERRDITVVQDYFSKAWKIEGTLGSLEGSTFNQILQAYTNAEFTHDWNRAKALHGDNTSTDLLDRTNAQRRADALCQMAADAVNSNKPSAPVKRVYNIITTAEVVEEQLRRWTNGAKKILDPDRYVINDIDGHPIAASEAFADMLVNSFRRITQNAAGVTLDTSTSIAVRFAHLPSFSPGGARNSHTGTVDLSPHHSVCGACGANADYPQPLQRTRLHHHPQP